MSKLQLTKEIHQLVETINKQKGKESKVESDFVFRKEIKSVLNKIMRNMVQITAPTPSLWQSGEEGQIQVLTELKEVLENYLNN